MKLHLDPPEPIDAVILQRPKWAAIQRDAAEIVELLPDAKSDAKDRNAALETLRGIVQASEHVDELKKSDAYWRMNDVRFKGPVELDPAPLSPESAGSPSVPASDSTCPFPG